MTHARHTLWEYAVLRVDWGWVTHIGEDGKWEFTASAWVDDEEIFTEKYAEMFWSKPLSKMGRMGWELIGNIPQNTLADGWLPGYPAPTAVPVCASFFFKRPIVKP